MDTFKSIFAKNSVFQKNGLTFETRHDDVIGGSVTKLGQKMCLPSRINCAKAFGNWSNGSKLRSKKTRGGQFDPPPSCLERESARSVR